MQEVFLEEVKFYTKFIMINRIISYALRYKLGVGIAFLLVVAVGIYSMRKVPVDAVPDITNNQVQIITQAPNLGAEVIEQFITYPIEVTISNLPEVQEIRSVSRFGLSVVTVVFKDAMGTYLPRQLIAEKLTEIREEIPEGFGKPMMGPITTGLGEIYQYTLEVAPEFKNKYNVTYLREVQDWIIKRQMAMLPGVVEVNSFGGHIRQYQVSINPHTLNAMGISVREVFESLSQSNANTGGAYIEKNHQAYFIKTQGLLTGPEAIENCVVSHQNGTPVRIKDVAEVTFATANRYGALTKDGQGEAVGGMVMMLKGANSQEVIKNVQQRVDAIQKRLPEGIAIVPFLSRSKLIEQTTATVRNNLLEGALIVIFVLVLLLGNWRGGLIVASTIPLSLLIAFVCMYGFGIWANLMSLGAIDFGIIVDGAVIIVESSVFFINQKRIKMGRTLTPKALDKVVYTSSCKMMNPAFFGQLIILIVFLPILVLDGIEGKMFIPMALTFIFAMLGAMLLCLTYVPVMTRLFIKPSENTQKSWADIFILWLEKAYEKILLRVLKKGRLLLIGALAIFLLAMGVFSKIGGEFIPELDEGDLAFHVLLKPGASLSESIKTTTQVEKIIKNNFPEVKHIISRIGVADIPTDPMPMDMADVFVILKEKEHWSVGTKRELIEKIKQKLAPVVGVNFEFSQPIEMRFNELLTGIREDIAIKLYGDDLNLLSKKAKQIAENIKNIRGVADMKIEAVEGLRQISIRYDRDLLSQYNVRVATLNKFVSICTAGLRAGQIFEGSKKFDLVLRIQEPYRKDLESIRNLPFRTSEGTLIPLGALATIKYTTAPMQISRDNTQRRIGIGINVRGRDIQTLVGAIQKKIEQNVSLPAGYYIKYTGAFENLKNATDKLKIVIPIALSLIFLLIYWALKSLRQTLIIYLAIPLATIGGIVALWLRGMPFSISAGIGFIVLFGVAVLNGLILISGFNQLLKEGIKNPLERILTGSKRRVRPILLTALTDILGFMPMAFSVSAGAEVQRPLATVVIGGLISATLLTLMVLPVLYKKLLPH